MPNIEVHDQATATNAELVHEMPDGRVFYAQSREEAITRCPFLSSLPVEQANVLLELVGPDHSDSETLARSDKQATPEAEPAAKKIQLEKASTPQKKELLPTETQAHEKIQEDSPIRVSVEARQAEIISEGLLDESEKHQAWQKSEAQEQQKEVTNPTPIIAESSILPDIEMLINRAERIENTLDGLDLPPLTSEVGDVDVNLSETEEGIIDEPSVTDELHSAPPLPLSSPETTSNEETTSPAETAFQKPTNEVDHFDEPVIVVNTDVIESEPFTPQEFPLDTILEDKEPDNISFLAEANDTASETENLDFEQLAREITELFAKSDERPAGAEAVPTFYEIDTEQPNDELIINPHTPKRGSEDEPEPNRELRLVEDLPDFITVINEIEQQPKLSPAAVDALIRIDSIVKDYALAKAETDNDNPNAITAELVECLVVLLKERDIVSPEKLIEDYARTHKFEELIEQLASLNPDYEKLVDYQQYLLRNLQQQLASEPNENNLSARIGGTILRLVRHAPSPASLAA